MLATAFGLLLAILPPSEPALRAQIRLVGPRRVELELRNDGGAAFDAEVHVGWTLAPQPLDPLHRRDLRAPVDPHTAAPYGANHPPRLALAPGALLRTPFDLAALGWGRSIQSVWPNRPLLEVAERATYQLSLEIEHGARRIRSNVITIALDGRAEGR